MLWETNNDVNSNEHFYWTSKIDEIVEKTCEDSVNRFQD